MQQQTVISAEGEAALVLRSHGILGSGSGSQVDRISHESRKNSLDNSNHGFSLIGLPSEKKTLDYSFHGSELPDDVPDDFDYSKEISNRFSSDQIDDVGLTQRLAHARSIDADSRDFGLSKIFDKQQK